MKIAQPLPLCATLLLLSFTLPRADLHFAVKEKTKLAKVFDAKYAFHSTSISIRVDGKDVDSGMSGMAVHLEESSHAELQDEYGALKDNQPATLKRTYDKLSGKSSQRVDLPEGAPAHGPTETSKDRSSELEGKTVLFTLGDKGEYTTAFEDGKGDAALLDKLEEDMDLRGLLSGSAVEADKSWEIDAQAFHNVLHVPGGDLKLATDDEKDRSQRLGPQLQENAKGKAKGTYKGTREVDGHKYALVALEAEIDSHAQREDSEKNPKGTGALELKIGYVVEGELLWDVEAGHFHSCKLESKTTLTMKNTVSMDHGGESHEIERTTEFEGEGELKATIGD